jgi:hypothetical protein
MGMWNKKDVLKVFSPLYIIDCSYLDGLLKASNHRRRRVPQENNETTRTLSRKKYSVYILYEDSRRSDKEWNGRSVLGIYRQYLLVLLGVNLRVGTANFQLVRINLYCKVATELLHVIGWFIYQCQAGVGLSLACGHSAVRVAILGIPIIPFNSRLLAH